MSTLTYTKAAEALAQAMEERNHNPRDKAIADMCVAQAHDLAKRLDGVGSHAPDRAQAATLREEWRKVTALIP